jgi:hypothetical protein
MVPHIAKADAHLIRSWLASIGETDAQIINEVLENCARDDSCRRYFLERAAERREAA